MQNNKITLSIVSHGHREMVEKLLSDLMLISDIYKVVITINIKGEKLDYPSEIATKIVTVRNTTPKGFSENHNFAFTEHCDSELFCVLNPDLRLIDDPFPKLVSSAQQSNIALLSPVVVNPSGEIEDSFRKFPSPLQLVLRKLGIHDGSYGFNDDQILFQPVWLAGMFMLFRAEDFRKVGGFDEGFFMYCEDVDICLRLRQLGKDLMLVRSTKVVHDARRDSRVKFRYMYWHMKSLIKLWIRYLGRCPDVSSSC